MGALSVKDILQTQKATPAAALFKRLKLSHILFPGDIYFPYIHICKLIT